VTRWPRVLALALSACYMRDPAPRYPQLGPSGGYAPADFDSGSACADWQWASSDPEANKHASFPDNVPFSCFGEVGYEPGRETIVSVPSARAGCAYPTAADKQRLLARAFAYERVASGSSGGAVPLELACRLSKEVRQRTAAANARTLRSFAASIDDSSPRYLYAVSGTFGYGNSEQNESRLLGWRPGDPCVDLDEGQRAKLSVNNIRARRVAEAWKAGVAPLVTVSGGAVHGRLVEAFMLGHLAVCDGGVPADRVLYDPCADHTHTNFRNTGAMMVGFGARTAYLITDDFIQSDYMQDFVWFESIGGSIDQRALRDWGHLIGSWRQASRGIDAGFWYTPYRFWAEPASGLGSFTCVGDAPIDP